MTEWTEEDSAIYRQLAQIAVPARVEQLATLLTLIPFAADAAYRVVELASGEGLLSKAIAAAFPKASLLALDYEETMRQATAHQLQAYGERAQVDCFDIFKDNWFDKLQDADLVISSLCIHHLDEEGKQRLFKAVQQRLSAKGAFLIADLVLPQTPQARRLFAAQWDYTAEAASIEKTLSRDLFQHFENSKWNYYRHPDDFDKPSSLFEQLIWLNKAGFPIVDCFWMQAGHAIYGGYQSKQSDGLTFEDSLRISQKAL